MNYSWLKINAVKNFTAGKSLHEACSHYVTPSQHIGIAPSQKEMWGLPFCHYTKHSRSVRILCTMLACRFGHIFVTYLLTCLGYLLHNRLDFLLWYNIWYNMQEFNVQSENWLIASLWFFCLVYTFVVLFASRSRQMVRKRRTISHLRRATSRRRRQRETGPTEDILQLAKNSQMYSPLLNNYTLPGNSSAAGRGNGSSSMHHHDEGAVVYGKTELVVGNLRHFQEYSIEVALYSNDFDDNNYVNNDADKFSQWNTDTLCSVM